MLILYYWPGASSMVPHIVLEEIGTPYQRQLVNLAQGEHKSDAYLKINPHGKVPALAIDNTVLTENVAILIYLARRFVEEARCLSRSRGSRAQFIRPLRILSGLSDLLLIELHTATSKRLLVAFFGTIALR